MILGVIPARGGSKAIPKKSIALCAGRPLLAYTCEAALQSRRLSHVLLSTDDEEIASLGKEFGVSVPFLRPPELAKDDTPMVDVLKHVIAWSEQTGSSPEAIVLLQPTSPLRRADHIDDAIELLAGIGAQTVVSVVQVPHQYGPDSLLRMRDGMVTPWNGQSTGPLRRQDKQVAYARNGPAVLVTRASVIRQGMLYGDPTLGYEMSRRDSLDVDDADDLEMAALLLESSRSRAQQAK